MGELVGEQLEEISKVLGWSNNNVVDLVSGKVWSSHQHWWCERDVTNRKMGCQEVEEGDSVAGEGIYVDHMAGQMARVGAVIKRKVVNHKTDHSISLVVISNPTYLSGMVGFGVPGSMSMTWLDLTRGMMGRS